MTQTRLKSGVTLFFLQILAESAAINVALDKTGKYCSEIPLSKKFFDGDTMNVESITERCGYPAYLEIELGSTLGIDYVIVYTGKGNDQGQLDFFLVERYNSENVFELCSQYPGFANVAETGRGMRLNCYPPKKHHIKVFIKFSKDEPLHITEIAIHSIAIAKVRDLLYAGCFEAFPFINSFTWPECAPRCFYRYITIAVKSDKTCHCVERVDRKKEIPTKHCNVKCDDDGRSCGGLESYSVYRFKPSLPIHNGCMKTSKNYTEEATLSGSMTVTKCLQHCDQHLYAILQAGDFCMCLNEILVEPVFGTDDCKTKCTGDESFICGGIEHATTFLNCKKNIDNSSINESCSEHLQCANSFDMYGVCVGGCKQGFTGEHCLEKVVGGCDFEPCDTETSTCRSSNSSYVCDCKPGFVKAVNETCVAGSSHAEQIRSFVLLITIPIFLMVFLASMFGYKAIMNQESLIVDDNTVIRRTTLKH